MKKIYLILSVFALVFTACETDFEVNAEWEETTVVFGLLDKAKEIQFIKVNKAFLGEADALQMAQHSDSVNFEPFDYNDSTGDLQVKLYKIDVNDTIERILKDTLLLKDDGLFASDNNIVYYFNTPEGDDFLSKNTTYSLVINNVKTGNIVSSSTEIIKGFNFEGFDGLSGTQTSYNFSFYNLYDGENKAYYTFEWEPSKTPNAVIYQFALRFHYEENEVAKELLWTQTEVNEREKILTIYGKDFFSFLENNLVKDNAVREFISIDIEMTLGAQDLKTYILVNEPITGIVQERPQFTNIENGIGLFSSRHSKVISNLGLNPATLEHLKSIDGLDRNFQ
jgi:hypothetical protein